MASSRTVVTWLWLMPFALRQMYRPLLSPSTDCRYSCGRAAASPMVWIPTEIRRAAVWLPQPYRLPMGRGHIFSGISSGNRVCVLSGFVKSLAILARSLLVDIPTLTVNPKVSRTSSRIRPARPTGSSVPETSM